MPKRQSLIMLRQPANLLLAVALTIGTALLLWSTLGNGNEQTLSFAVVLMTLALFATARIPEYLTAVLLFLACSLLSLAPPEVIFSGFQSTALWLVFAGLIIGVAVTESGLGQRIAASLSAKLRGSYLRLILGMTLLGYGFAFLMPAAMGRVVLLVPIAMALAPHFSFEPGRNGYIGMILAVAVGQFIPAFSVLPANVPNMVLIGMAESQFDINLLYGEYLLLHLPFLGLIKAVLIALVICWFYPDTPRFDQVAATKPSPMDNTERKVAWTVAALLVLWFFDFVHHVSPAWVGLAGAIYLLLPRFGVINSSDFSSRINFSPVLFIAGVIGLGNMIAYSGLSTQLGNRLIEFLPLAPDQDLLNFFSISLASTLAAIVATNPGAPAVITPLTPELAQATGLSMETILMMQINGFSLFPFAYQAPSIVVGLQMAGVRLQYALRPLLMVAFIGYLLLPFNYFWWQLTGWL